MSAPRGGSLLTDVQASDLLDAAKAAAQHAYAPYSHFSVGAAVLDAAGSVTTGVNIENASYGLTLCAERSALAAAVSAGQRNFVAIAVYASTRPHGAVTPCGACRQVLAELLPAEAPVIMNDEAGRLTKQTVRDLLPAGFDLARGDSSTPGGSG